jgi:hypothetical protein
MPLPYLAPEPVMSPEKARNPTWVRGKHLSLFYWYSPPYNPSYNPPYNKRI